MNDQINHLCQELEGEFAMIPTARKAILSQLSNYISAKIAAGQTPKIVVICTHNSRRSHIGQLWLAVGAEYFRLPNVQTFSGGTEATAFNQRAVAALQRSGFNISAKTAIEIENPIYQLRWRQEMEPYEAFSKKYGAAPNPKEEFAAVMVCSEADEGCPVVVGCDFRLSLPFDDPKEFDGTDMETAKYDERVRHMGREMLFVTSQVKA